MFQSLKVWKSHWFAVELDLPGQVKIPLWMPNWEANKEQFLAQLWMPQFHQAVPSRAFYHSSSWSNSKLLSEAGTSPSGFIKLGKDKAGSCSRAIPAWAPCVPQSKPCLLTANYCHCPPHPSSAEISRKREIPVFHPKLFCRLTEPLTGAAVLFPDNEHFPRVHSERLNFPGIQAQRKGAVLLPKLSTLTMRDIRVHLELLSLTWYTGTNWNFNYLRVKTEKLQRLERYRRAFSLLKW